MIRVAIVALFLWTGVSSAQATPPIVSGGWRQATARTEVSAAGVLRGMILVVGGEGGRGTFTELATHPAIHKLSFTGSTEVGGLLYRQAAGCCGTSRWGGEGPAMPGATDPAICAAPAPGG